MEGQKRERWILHVDMDAFYASVEQRDHPEYRGCPVVVGGRSPRSVVATCSYEARQYGIHSAMPMFTARRLCPHAVFLPVRMARYTEVSEQIMAIFHETSPLVEQLSVDEAFLDLSGMEKLGGAERIARDVQDRIARELHLSASVGLAPNKFLAKLASDMRKPHGFVRITADEAEALLAPMPVRNIFGIGTQAARKLEQFGVVTIGQLARTETSVLQQVFGSNASRIRDLARGLDDRPVVPEEDAKSIGKETTFDSDLIGYEACRDRILDLSGQTGWRLRKQGLAGRTVTVKVKYGDFHTVTRSVSSDQPVAWDEDIFQLADGLLHKIDLRQGVRLLGVTVSDLQRPGDAPVLSFAENERLARRNRTLDALKDKFGEQIIHRGGFAADGVKKGRSPKE
jgi:DNA polymerase-4